MAIKLEMVCHANECRSKLAEAIANKYVQEHNINDIQISSSGIYVDAIKQRKVPLDFIIHTVYKGINNGIYSPKELQEIEEAISKDTVPILGEYAERAAKTLSIEERKNRDHHVHKNRLVLTNTANQTIITSDLIAIVCMDDYVKAGVFKIYSCIDSKPSIDTLGNYIGASPAEIPHTLGISKKEFAELYERMQDYVPRTIEKFLNKD